MDIWKFSYNKNVLKLECLKLSIRLQRNILLVDSSSENGASDTKFNPTSQFTDKKPHLKPIFTTDTLGKKIISFIIYCYQKAKIVVFTTDMAVKLSQI